MKLPCDSDSAGGTAEATAAPLQQVAAACGCWKSGDGAKNESEGGRAEGVQEVKEALKKPELAPSPRDPRWPPIHFQEVAHPCAQAREVFDNCINGPIENVQ